MGYQVKAANPRFARQPRDREKTILGAWMKERIISIYLGKDIISQCNVNAVMRAVYATLKNG